MSRHWWRYSRRQCIKCWWQVCPMRPSSESGVWSLMKAAIPTSLNVPVKNVSLSILARKLWITAILRSWTNDNDVKKIRVQEPQPKPEIQDHTWGVKCDSWFRQANWQLAVNGRGVHPKPTLDTEVQNSSRRAGGGASDREEAFAEVTLTAWCQRTLK